MGRKNYRTPCQRARPPGCFKYGQAPKGPGKLKFFQGKFFHGKFFMESFFMESFFMESFSGKVFHGKFFSGKVFSGKVKKNHNKLRVLNFNHYHE
jgi:hypothetical protein